MTQVTIHRLNTRLRVAPASGDSAARLERLLSRMVDTALEPALRRCGIDGRGELCVRRVVAPALRLDLDAPDGALIERWAQCWAEAIVRRLTKRDAEVLHYGSRTHALTDLLIAATAGDFSRAWAWRRLDLWPAESAVTGSDAAGLVMRALLAHPTAAVAAVVRLAAAPAAFERWLRQSGVTALQALAQAVLRAGGGTALTVPADAAASAVAQATAARLLQRSAIARALGSVAPQVWLAPALAPVPELAPASSRRPGQTARQPQTHCPALAVLVLAEVEPAWLGASTPELGALLASLTNAWAGAAARAGKAGTAEAPLPAVPPAAAVAAAAGAQAATTSPHSGHTGAQRPPQSRAGTIAEAASPPIRAATEAGAPAVSSPLPDLRRRGQTRFGGLLFLLNLARDLDWPDALLHHPVLALRGLRWSLHRLALLLLPLDADDPAALAFAGWLPGDETHAAEQAPPSAAETDALAEIRSELLRALRKRLRDAAEPEVELLARVCRRRAEIVADPGWLELHLSLDDVSTALRGAGLDLDPGWLPWLGLVIRFVYD